MKIKDQQFDAIFVTDTSFFFANGMEKLEQLGITAPVFSQYTVDFPAIRPLVERVIYSFPKDIADGETAAFALSAEAMAVLTAAIESCHTDTECAKQELLRQNGFNSESGTRDRELILKKIESQRPVAL